MTDECKSELATARSRGPRRGRGPIVAFVTLAALACRRESEPTPARNVVVIVIDTLRADALSCYGYERNTSPHLDALAADAVLFENAQSAAPWTAPSLVTLMTSLYPSVHGVLPCDHAVRMNERVTTLAETLRARGYATAAFTEGGFASPELGLDQGFAEYYCVEDDPTQAASAAAFKSGRLRRNLERADLWLKQRDERPFFLFVHTYETHTPFAPPEEFVRHFRPDWDEAAEHAEVDQVRARLLQHGEIDADALRLLVAHREHCAPCNDIDPEQLGRKLLEAGVGALEPDRLKLWRDLYDAEIRYTDNALSRLLARLSSPSLRDSTMVVVVSDHGEAFGEHGKFGHGSELHEECLRVALMIRAPGFSARRVSDLVRTVDVMPTVLELADVSFESLPLQGRSLVPLMAGRSLRAAPSFSHAISIPQHESHLWSVRDGRWRLIWDAAEHVTRLYDLELDPAALQDVAQQQPDVSRRLAALLRSQAEIDALLAQRVSGPVERLATEHLHLEQLGYGSSRAR